MRISSLLAENEYDYKVICGCCGVKYVKEPTFCVSCGNDAEFEPIV